MVAGKGDPDDRFYAFWRPVSKGHLLVGWSDREVREVQRNLLHGLGWGLGTTFLFAVGFAVLLAYRAQQKIDVFATTLSQVGQGDVTRRVPLRAPATISIMSPRRSTPCSITCKISSRTSIKPPPTSRTT